MSIKTNNRSQETVWTLQRLLSVAASLVVISALAIVSYHFGDFVPMATATTLEAGNANAPAPATSGVDIDVPPE